jgi:hypothetical protein
MFKFMKPVGISFLLLTFLFLFSDSRADGIINNTSSFTHSVQVRHQGINTLKMIVTYRRMPGKPIVINSSEYIATIDSVLSNYPNSTDWWEIVNKKLTAVLMQKYPDVDSLASDIEVNWVSGAGIDYGHRDPTRCLTARTRANKLYEYFGFRSAPDYVMKLKGKTNHVQLDLLYQYIDHIADTDYPDGLETERYFKKLVNENSQTSITIGALNDAAAKAMLEKYPQMQNVKSVIELMRGKKVRTRFETIQFRLK